MILNDDELQRLEDFLGSDACGEESLFVDEIHGMLSAIVCTPGEVPPEEWLPMVFDGEPEFADLQQAADIKALLMRMHNEILSSLNAAGEYLPLFVERVSDDDEPVLDPEGWCHGFVQGMSLRTDLWMDSLRNDLKDVLYPILTLAADNAGLFPASDEPRDPEMLEDLGDLIPDSVEAVYAYWYSGEGRPESQVSLCPCGSGNNFNECCGAKRRTLH